MSKRAAAKRLIPLGAAALAAGCGGGAHSGLPAQADTAPQQHATTTALLTVQIPARGTSKAKRAPKYISQGSAAIGYSIATSGAAQPAESVTALPSPGPVATSVTLPVTAPVGTDTVAVHIYDAVPSPGASATPNVLSAGTATATVAAGQSSPLNVQALGVAAGVQLGAASSTFEVFENHPQPQTKTLTATPIDADGYAITGNLANAAALAVPAGVAVSPAAIASAGPITLTYAANGTTQMSGTVTTGLPLDTATGSTDNVAFHAMQYFYLITDDGTNSQISAIDPATQTIAATATITGADFFDGAAVAGCASGETLVTLNPTTMMSEALTFAPPSSASAAAPTVTDVTSIFAPANSNSPEGVTQLAADANCGMYSDADTTLTRYSNFPTVTSAAVAQTGWTANSGIGVSGSTLYGTFTDTSAPQYTLSAQSLPLTGGTTTQLGTYNSTTPFDSGLLVGGTFVYDKYLDCGGGTGINFASLPSLTITQDPSAETGDAVAPNGTLYQYLSEAGTVSKHRKAMAARMHTYFAAHPASAMRRPAAARRVLDAAPLFVTIPNAVFGAASSDGRFMVAVSCSTTPCSVQVYTNSATPGGTPTTLGAPISLPVTQTDVDDGFFPH